MKDANSSNTIDNNKGCIGLERKRKGNTNNSVLGFGIPHEHSDSVYRLHKKKNNLNKATRIHFESIPRDLSGLISIKNDSQQITRPSKPSTVFPNARTRRGSDSLCAFLWTAASRVL